MTHDLPWWAVMTWHKHCPWTNDFRTVPTLRKKIRVVKGRIKQTPNMENHGLHLGLGQVLPLSLRGGPTNRGKRPSFGFDIPMGIHRWGWLWLNPPKGVAVSRIRINSANLIRSTTKLSCSILGIHVLFFEKMSSSNVDMCTWYGWL